MAQNTQSQPIHQEPHPPALLDSLHAAGVLNVSVLTLADWRCKGTGPAFLKVGRCVRYRRSDLEAWLNSRTVTNTAQADALEA
ncbi:helix-turn-helix transcriptional regulator [Holophaga foetida]|uniref:helix-turn-helix transcriptional regulator n=1 Tax=Holophaga foetida TaxID=35839 RepID=UPI0002473B52|nr:helix-turn-helix domain-containing protein [Holophaga foetida]